MLYYAALGLCLPFLCVGESESEPPAVDETVEMVLPQVAMPEMGNDRLGSILNRYYAEGLGGVSNWENVVSLRVSGQLKLESGTFKFASYRKKPHYIKMTIRGKQVRIKRGYDGTTAWQVAKRGASAVEMDAVNARAFIHGAHFKNYLLYPRALGKQIEYLDTIPVDGEICHQVRVTLDSGYQVDYFIEVESFLELKVVTTDLRTEKVTTVVYEDYIRKLGMPVAQKIVSSENGVWVSTLELEEVKVNSGVMPWMFKMPK